MSSKPHESKVVILADHRRKKVLKLLREYTETLHSLKELEQLIYEHGGLFLFRQMLNRDPVVRRKEKINPLVDDATNNLIFYSVYRSPEDEEAENNSDI